MTSYSKLKQAYTNIFFEEKATYEKARLFFAPGRINLIGEHIDYNGGLVLPMAINLGTYAVIEIRDDYDICLYSNNYPDNGIIKFNVQAEIKKEYNWADYIKGVIVKLKEEGLIFNKGFNLYIDGELPNSSGLSSSASLEVVAIKAITACYNFKLSNEHLAIVAQKSEVDFVGVNCGIMDQFIIANALENTVLLLNTANCNYQYIPFLSKEYCLLVMNTNKKRTLADSKYNERYYECQEGLKIVKNRYAIDNLCQLEVSQLEEIKNIFHNEKIYYRLLHVISENERVKMACECLSTDKFEKLGKLLNDSHLSLRNNYEVSCYELDTIVDVSRNAPGIIGARMTGAGFGGSAIALVTTERAQEAVTIIQKRYFELTNLKADLFIVKASSGVREILEVTK